MKNKKAIAMSALALIILTLAGGLVITLFGVQLTKNAKHANEMEQCRQSILYASESKQAGVFKGKPMGKLNCPRQELEIKKSDVVEGGLINQDNAHKIIADAMADCWYMIGEGKIDPFSNWDTKGSHCLICTTIKFDDNLQEYYYESATNEDKAEERGENAFISSPIPYMLETNYKGDTTYFEYIYNTDNPGSFFNPEELNIMLSSIVAEDSTILIKLYKPEDKNAWDFVISAGIVVGGIGIVIGGVLLSKTIIFAPIGLALMNYGGGVIAAGVGKFIYTAIFDPTNLNPFAACEECEGIGSLKFLPSDSIISEQIETTYYPGTDNEVKESGAYCQIITN